MRRFIEGFGHAVAVVAVGSLIAACAALPLYAGLKLTVIALHWLWNHGWRS